MSVAATLVRNVVSSWMGFGVQVLITLLLTPCIIEGVGLEAYGIWLFLGSAVGYYGLVDMGLRAGITQCVTRQVASGDIEGLRRQLATYNPVMSILGCLVVLISLGVWQVLPHVIEVSQDQLKFLGVTVIVQSIGIGIGIAMVPYAAVLVGLERYDLSEGSAILSRIISALLIYIGIRLGGGLVALSIAYALGNLFDSFLRFTLATKLLPGIRGIAWVIDRKDILGLIRNTYLNTIVQLSRQVIYFSSSIIVGVLFTASAIPAYSIAASFVEYATKLLMVSTRVLFPTMVAIDEKGTKTQLLELYKLSSRLATGFSLAIFIIGAVWIEPFLRLWLGSISGADEIIQNAPIIFAILGASTIAVAMQRSGAQLLLAKDAVGSLAKLMLMEALATLSLSFGFGYLWGLKGVAIGTLVPSVLFSWLFYIPKHANILRSKYSMLLGAMLFRPILFGFALFCLLILLKNFNWDLSDWFHFLITAGLSSALSLLISLPLLFTNQELRYGFQSFSRAKRLVS
ncbi:MAG: lipopolysaccharide biosynthesis protein [Pirellula sp.]